MRNKLFTIGHSTHSIENFVDLLLKRDITAVCDVRSMPYSRFNPQFNQEFLKKQLKAQGISYVFLGKELGARSANLSCYEDGKVQYSRLANEPLFREGLRRVQKGMQDHRIALMCSEKEPLDCHRTILVCRELRSHCIEIEHILANGELEAHSAAEMRLMDLLEIKEDMFRDEKQCIEEAYEKQAKRIAYEGLAAN